METFKKYTLSILVMIQDDFYTHGKEIDGLLSVQFVKKVIDLVESKDYTYQVDTKQ